MTDNTELKRLVDRVLTDRRFCGDENHKALADGVLALIAENDSQRKDLQNLRTDNAQLIYAIKQEQQSYLVLRADRDQLRAEIAGLKTGYEAYERVNAELKAEVEGLRKLGPSKEIIWCACGDGYPVNSYGSGFMDANNGVCANCDAALGQGEQS